MTLTMLLRGISSQDAYQGPSVRSPRVNAPIVPERLPSDQVHFGSGHLEQPVFPTQAPKREWFFQRWFNQIGRFFKYIGKAIHALFGMERPKPFSKQVGKQVGHMVEFTEQHPQFQQAMQVTKEDWEALLLTDPRLKDHPELRNFSEAAVEMIQSPEGRQALLGGAIAGLITGMIARLTARPKAFHGE